MKHRSQRWPHEVRIKLVTKAGSIPAVTRNGSRGGLSVLCDTRLRPDERATVVILGRSLSGTVAWIRADRAGIAFDQELSANELRMIRKGIVDMNSPAFKQAKTLPSHGFREMS